MSKKAANGTQKLLTRFSVPLLPKPLFVLFFCLKKNSEKSCGAQERTLVIDKDSLSIDGTKYSREHIYGWNRHWAESGGLNTALGHAFQAELSKKSHSIRFEYGDKEILVAGCMTETQALRLMEAINAALARAY